MMFFKAFQDRETEAQFRQRASAVPNKIQKLSITAFPPPPPPLGVSRTMIKMGSMASESKFWSKYHGITSAMHDSGMAEIQTLCFCHAKQNSKWYILINVVWWYCIFMERDKEICYVAAVNPELGTTLVWCLNQSCVSAVLLLSLIAIKFNMAKAQCLNWAPTSSLQGKS